MTRTKEDTDYLILENLEDKVSKITYLDIPRDTLTNETFLKFKNKIVPSRGAYFSFSTLVPPPPKITPGTFLDRTSHATLKWEIHLYNQSLYLRELVLAYVYHAFEKVSPGWKSSWITIDRNKALIYLIKLTSWDRWNEIVYGENDYICYRFFPYEGERLSYIKYSHLFTLLLDQNPQRWESERKDMFWVAPPRLRTNEPFVLVSLTLEEVIRYLITSRDYRSVHAFLCKVERETPADDSISRWTRSWNYEPRLLEVICRQVYGEVSSPSQMTRSIPPVIEESPTLEEMSRSKVNASSDDLVEKVGSFCQLSSWERFFLFQCMIYGIHHNGKKDGQDTYNFDDFKEDPIFSLGRIAYIYTPCFSDFIEKCSDNKRYEIPASTIHIDVYGPVSKMIHFLRYMTKISPWRRQREQRERQVKEKEKSLQKGQEKSQTPKTPLELSSDLTAYIFPSYVEMKTAELFETRNNDRFIRRSTFRANRDAGNGDNGNEADGNNEDDNGDDWESDDEDESIVCQEIQWLEVYPLE